LVRQLSGSRVSRLLSRCSCVNVVSRQTERGTCVSGLLVMFNRVRWPYVWLLDSSESSCFDSSSRSTCVPPRQSTVSPVPSVLGLHLQPIGHNALIVSVNVAWTVLWWTRRNENTNIAIGVFIISSTLACVKYKFLNMPIALSTAVYSKC